MANNILLDILVVAGGGSGGARGDKGGGGGGAGGLLHSQNHFLPSGGTFNVVVGDGGALSSGRGNNGQNSSFDTLIAIGGGGGGKGQPGNGTLTHRGRDGGSGGGSSEGIGIGGLGVAGQGYNGGYSVDVGGAGGGGGGAGEVGSNSSGSPIRMKGGDGLEFDISGILTYYAGGGAGGDWWNGVLPNNPGGLGGGGASAISGTPNTGGGGGAGQSGSTNGAQGGSGLVVISYPTGHEDGTGGVITYANGRTIHTFLTDGVFTAPRSGKFVIKHGLDMNNGDINNIGTLQGLGENITVPELKQVTEEGALLSNYVIDRAETNMMLNAFRVAYNESLTQLNMLDGIADEYIDESGTKILGSLKLNGTTDYLTIPDSPDFDFFGNLVEWKYCRCNCHRCRFWRCNMGNKWNSSFASWTVVSFGYGKTRSKCRSLC